MKKSWFAIALAATALAVLPLAPAFSAASSQISVTPSSVSSYESENFYVTVDNAGPLLVSSINVTMPLGLQPVGLDQNPDWIHLLTRNQTSYTAAWFGGRSIGNVLIPPGNSTTFAFSANVPGPGIYRLAISALYFDGSSASLGTLAVVVSTPSLLGLDIRSSVYVLGAIVIFLPVAQWMALLTVRRGHGKVLSSDSDRMGTGKGRDVN